MSAAAKTKVQSIVDEHAVVVFSKTYCPYCKATKKTLKDAGAQAFVVELDEVSDGADLQAAVRELFHHSTVPAVFINHALVGGNDALQATKSKGKLGPMLQAAGVAA
ncbi:putative glutaredoxin Grx1 [Ascobolus immersus RN42]|uniref:Putative glutaredoxin Grx1 n=1 Tax=Ascobolus immersus RN42 TaxID=1160509 RepID=A0A3N4ID83_ASCIM|nr:putative glutaredoxin Grx1 [Ascobolus immersus RN42]